MNNNILLKYLNKGSFGYIFEDNYDNIYKLTEMVIKEIDDKNVYYILERNNLIETIMLNFFLNSNNEVTNNEVTNNEVTNNEVTNDNNNKNKNKNKKYNNLVQTNKSVYYISNELNQIYNFENKLLSSHNNYIIINNFLKFKKVILPNKYDLDNIINTFKTYSKQLLTAVATLHHNGFVHGDIKFSNIMLDYEKNNLLLIDLGGIKPIDCNYFYNTCTITSRCPEELLAQRYEMEEKKKSINLYKSSGAKSDIWSIGIFLNEIILGKCTVLKYYNVLSDKKLSEEDIEKEMLLYYNSKTFIEVEEEFLNLKHIKNKDEKYKNSENFKELIRLCKIVEKMLVINPDNRIESIEKIYQEIFNEQFEFNFKKEYKYEYPFLKNNKFLEFRNNFYPSVIITCLKIHNMLVIPFLLDLLDRYFNELLKNNIDIYNYGFSILETIIISSICISSIFITFENLYLNVLLKKSNFINTNVHEIQKFIINIITTLNYDIFRPFNIFGNISKITCSKNNLMESEAYERITTKINKDIPDFWSETHTKFEINNYKCDTFYKLSKLDKIYTEIVQNNIIEISPQYYIDKLLL
jgi:serine/threonine protein kinase